MDRKSKTKEVLIFPDPISTEERRAVQRIKAAILAAYIDSDLAVRVILKLEQASEEQRRACLYLLDLTGPNLELAVWAWGAPAEQAQSILGLAKSFTEIERKPSDRRSRKSKR